MFVVVYSFIVKSDKHLEFIGAWKKLTNLIHEHEGSFGARLHNFNQDNFLAYAQWPDRSTWENAGNKLPAEAHRCRVTMRNSCIKIETVYELNVVEDLLH